MALVSRPMCQTTDKIAAKVFGSCLFFGQCVMRRVAMNSAQSEMNGRRIRGLVLHEPQEPLSVTSIKRHFEPSTADGPVRLSERLLVGNPTILFAFNLHLGSCKPWQTFEPTMK